MTTPAVQRALDAAFREEWGRIVAALIRRTGNWDLAEECAQDAFTEALRRWPVDGVPQRPGAWLTTVAGNRAIDRLRRGARGAELLEQAGREALTQPEADEQAMPELFDETDEIEDDRLRLIFTCCHPALPLEGRVALTLRSLAGPQHRRDRQGVPGLRGDDGQAPDSRQGKDRRRRRSRTGCRPAICCRNAPPGCSRCCT